MHADHKTRNPIERPPSLPASQIKEKRRNCLERIVKAYELPASFKEVDQIIARLYEEKRALDVMLEQAYEAKNRTK